MASARRSPATLPNESSSKPELQQTPKHAPSSPPMPASCSATRVGGTGTYQPSAESTELETAGCEPGNRCSNPPLPLPPEPP
mmetsp:Transcript_22121/g.57724  ORF Transcript_22121/g.57724 Transcript_22121/m.57724 type:complete len:82 (+) Transcript_22121:639-884(+)